jgi:hypothetical protein
LYKRLDLNYNNNDNTFVRYFYSDRDRFIPGNFGGIADGTTSSAFGRQNMQTYTLAAGWNHTLGPSMLNELRFGFNKATSHGEQEPFGQPGIPLAGVPNDPRVAGGLAGINFSTGGYRLGSPDFKPKYQLTQQTQITDSFSWFSGANQWMFGVDVMMPLKNSFLDVPATRGSVTFRPTFTGNVLGDFLLGYVADAQLSNVNEVHQEMSQYSFYAQDDWKPNGSVTVNLGLRYDYMTPQLEEDNRLSNFNGVNGLVLAKDGSVFDRATVKPDRNNFAPRLGITYVATPSTLLRGGYGLFYNLYDRIGSEDQLSLNAPFLINSQVQGATVQPQFFLKDGFPSNFLTPNLAVQRIRAINPEGTKAYYHQWSVGGQKQLNATLVASADYVGTLGRNIWTLRNLNQPDPVTKVLPFPTLGAIEYADQDGTSHYNGLEVALEKRFSNSYSFRTTYTLSKAIDDGGEHLFTGGSPSFLQNARDRSSWEGPADQDTRHRLAANWVIDIPVGPGHKFLADSAAGKILGGFNFSGVITARTGRPFTVTQGGNNVGQLMTGLPNRIGDGNGEKTVDNWFDKTAFQAVTSGTFGNSGRNILRGPGLYNIDTALQRRIALGGQTALELRWEVFNILNTVEFGLPDSNISNATFGTIARLAGDPRVMQFAVRFVF